MTHTVNNQSYVTLVVNDSYVAGGLVLGRSLVESDTNRQITCMITSKVGVKNRKVLQEVFDNVVEVELLDSKDEDNLALLCRPELGITFTKLFAWKLVQFEKCVFMDADTMVLQNIDDCFEREEISAAPDVGWPDCFNSGVFVLEPSLETFQQLVFYSRQEGSFDGGDQGLLNSFFSWWSTRDIKHHLPFTYNLHVNASYFYAPAYQRFKDDVKVIHFIGAAKPWMYHRNRDGSIENTSNKTLEASKKYVELWWNTFDRMASDKIIVVDHTRSSLYPETSVVDKPRHSFVVESHSREAVYSREAKHGESVYRDGENRGNESDSVGLEGMPTFHKVVYSGGAGSERRPSFHKVRQKLEEQFKRTPEEPKRYYYDPESYHFDFSLIKQRLNELINDEDLEKYNKYEMPKAKVEHIYASLDYSDDEDDVIVN